MRSYDTCQEVFSFFYPVQDDTFRVGAYLLLLIKLDIDRYQRLRELVLSDPTYAQEAKDFVRQIDAQT